MNATADYNLSILWHVLHPQLSCQLTSGVHFPPQDAPANIIRSWIKDSINASLLNCITTIECIYYGTRSECPIAFKQYINQRFKPARAEIIAPKPLTALPEEIIYFRALESLSLWGHQLTTLPDWLGECTSLRVLYVPANNLIELPACLGNLNHLKGIQARTNKLTTLPKEIAKCLNLEWLDLENNSIHTFPEELFKLKKLRWIVLRHNGMSLEKIERIRLFTQSNRHTC